MAERYPKKTLLLVLSILLAFFLAACSSGEKEVRPAEYLLAKAETAWSKKKWTRASEFYGQVRDYYPYHTKASLSQYRSAEGLYRAEKYHESLAAFETFEELHPTHKDRAQVLLRIGQSHFRLSRGIDRDQIESHKAIEVLARVVKQFPKSVQAKEAEELIQRAYLKLVRHELYVARFYRKTKAYTSAIGRFEKALSYPDVGYGPVLEAELEITKALAEGKRRPRIKVPAEPRQDQAKWWKIWR
jgi:outer membrane protein assembly factor BamD